MIGRQGVGTRASSTLLCNRLYDASVRPMARQYGVRCTRFATVRDGALEPARADRRPRPLSGTPTDEPGRRPVPSRLRTGAGPPAAPGAQVFHGLPFDLGPAPGRPAAGSSSTRPLTIDLRRGGAASHVVVAHLCDAWRDDAGERPAGLAVGHVVPVGEPLARYTVVDRSGRDDEPDRPAPVRDQRRDPRLGLGARSRRSPTSTNEVVDWRGPHAAQAPGRYAPAGQSGSLTIMPGHVRREPGRDVRLRAEPHRRRAAVAPRDRARAPARAGRAAPRAARRRAAGQRRHRRRGDRCSTGRPIPLARSPRFAVRVDGLGRTGARGRPRARSSGRRPAAGAAGRGAAADAAIVGWGTPRGGIRRQPDVERTESSSTWRSRPTRSSSLGRLGRARPRPRWPAALDATRPGAGRSRSCRPPASRSRSRSSTASTGERVPGPGPLHGRRRPLPAAGRPPRRGQPGLLRGHRRRPHPRVGRRTPTSRAGSRSTCRSVRVDVEVVGGFDRAPHRARIEVDPSTRRLELPLERTIDLHAGRWVTADTHVHFLAPSTALLQAAAEDVDLVNLLAAQWGDLYTNVTDLPWGSMADPSGRRLVVVGTENRQNMLGHLALLGAHRPTEPATRAAARRRAGWPARSTSSSPTGPIAAGRPAGSSSPPTSRCRTPRSRPTSSPARSTRSRRRRSRPASTTRRSLEWYRFLNLGYRLPIVAGTDKMSAEVPIGAVRAYVHLLTDEPLTFDGVGGRRPGRPDLRDVRSGPRAGGRRPRAGRRRPRCAAPAGSRSRSASGPPSRSSPTSSSWSTAGSWRPPTRPRPGRPSSRSTRRVEVAAGAWIAARSRSGHEIESAFTTSMAAHTSPVYVEVDGRPFVPSAEDAGVVEQVIVGRPDLGRRARGGGRPGRAGADGRLPRREPGRRFARRMRGGPRHGRRAGRSGGRVERDRDRSAGPVVDDPGVGRVVELGHGLRVAGQEVQVVGVRARRRRDRVVALVDEHEVAVGRGDRDVEVRVAGVDPLDARTRRRGESR